MGANIYALSLLAPLVAIVILLFRFGGLPKRREILLRIGLLVLGGLVTLFVPVTFAGSPMQPSASFLPAIAALVAIFFLRPLKLAVLLCGLCLVILGFGQVMYEKALYSPGVTDYQAKRVADREQLNLRWYRDYVAASADHDKKPLPSSYLDESSDEGVRAAASDAKSLEIQRNVVRDYKLAPFWHTFFTGLSHMQTRQTRVYFDGGILKSADLSRLHVRGFGEYRDGWSSKIPRA